jgi:hypothetical protein
MFMQIQLSDDREWYLNKYTGMIMNNRFVYGNLNLFWILEPFMYSIALFSICWSKLFIRNLFKQLYAGADSDRFDRFI